MFERFRRSPENASVEGLKAELEGITSRISELREQMTAWNDPVQADRDLLDRLTARQLELENEIEAAEESKAA